MLTTRSTASTPGSFASQSSTVTASPKCCATEAVRTVIDYLFGKGLHRISAECDARNERSARLLERAGFRREGYRPAYTWLKGEWTDDILYGLLAAQWRG